MKIYPIVQSPTGNSLSHGPEHHAGPRRTTPSHVRGERHAASAYPGRASVCWSVRRLRSKMVTSFAMIGVCARCRFHAIRVILLDVRCIRMVAKRIRMAAHAIHDACKHQ